MWWMRKSDVNVKMSGNVGADEVYVKRGDPLLSVLLLGE